MSIRNLPYANLSVSGSLRTKFNPLENAGQTFRAAQNVDTFDEFKTLGKIPGSTRVSNQHSGAVKSLHYFEYTPPEKGPRVRDVISLDAAGVLRRINADLSLTSLTTGLAAEPMADVTQQNRLYLTSPGQVALPTGGIKFDGTNVRNWGCVAPGSREIVKQAIDDHTNWSGSADVTLSTDTDVSQDGVASVVLSKTGASSTEAYMQRSGLAVDFSTGGDLLFVWLFVPPGALQKFATSGTCVQVRYGSTTLTSSDSHNFSVGELAVGWNLLSWDKTAPDATSGIGATLSNVQTIRLRLVFSSTGQTQSNFRWDKLYGTDDGQPSASDGGSGSIAAGTYRYRVAFLTENGFESNAGPASAGVTIGANREIDVSGIPISNDPQVVARALYRDLNGDAQFLLVDYINNNVDTTYTDDIPAAGLIAQEPYLEGDLFLDHSPPEPFVDVAIYENVCYGISASDRSVLVPSNILQAEGYRLVDQLGFEEDLVGVAAHQTGLLVFATDKIFLLTFDAGGEFVQSPYAVFGDVGQQFKVFEQTDESGLNGFRAKASIEGALVTVREDEAFLIVNPKDPWQVNQWVMDQFAALDPTRLDEMHIVHDRSRFRIVFFAKTSTVYDVVLVYQYGTSGAMSVTGDGPGVDPKDIRIGAWRSILLPTSINPQCSVMIERNADRPELWIGGNDGYVYWLQDPSTETWAENTGTAAMHWKTTFEAVRLGRDEDARGEPRFLSLMNAAVDSDTDVTLTIRLMNQPNGEVIANGSWTVTFAAGSTSQVIPIAEDLGARAEWAEVTLESQVSGATGRIRQAKLYYIPRGDFEGPRAAA